MCTIKVENGTWVFVLKTVVKLNEVQPTECCLVLELMSFLKNWWWLILCKRKKSLFLLWPNQFNVVFLIAVYWDEKIIHEVSFHCPKFSVLIFLYDSGCSSSFLFKIELFPLFTACVFQHPYYFFGIMVLFP